MCNGYVRGLCASPPGMCSAMCGVYVRAPGYVRGAGLRQHLELVEKGTIRDNERRVS